MNSCEWNRRGFTKRVNPSGEVIRVKTYVRGLTIFDNIPTRTIVAGRKNLAALLQIPWYDLLADLTITVEIERYSKRCRRFLKYQPSLKGE